MDLSVFWKGEGETGAGRYLPLVVFVVTSLLAVGLWWAASSRERAYLVETVRTEASWVRQELIARLEEHQRMLVGMALRWRPVDFVSQDAWEFDAGHLLVRGPGTAAVQWLEPDGEVRWTFARQEGADASAPDPTRFETVREALARARRENRATISGSFPLADGHRGVAVGVATLIERGFDGYMVATVDLHDLMEGIVGALGAAYTVAVAEGRTSIYRGGSPEGPSASRWSRRTEVDVGGLSLGILVTPSSSTVRRTTSPLPTVALVGGLLLAALLAVTVRLARVTALRSKEAQMTGRLQEQIEARRRAERTLQDRAEELARSNAELERFAYAVSHDLKQPLNAIAMNLQLMREDGGVGERGARRLEAAERGVRRLDRMIGDLLEYSRLGREGDQHGEVDCDEVVDRSLENLQGALQSAGARVEREPLPTVLGDSRQLVQLFQNLIDNAVKYGSDEAPRIRVGVSERREGEWVLAVEDNGIGIDPDDADQVFELFQRLDERQDVAGTGVGLATCKKIVENHGGEIWVEGRPGEGSTFYFTLPEVPSPSSADASASASSSSTGPPAGPASSPPPAGSSSADSSS